MVFWIRTWDWLRKRGGVQFIWIPFLFSWQDIDHSCARNQPNVVCVQDSQDAHPNG